MPKQAKFIKESPVEDEEQWGVDEEGENKVLVSCSQVFFVEVFT